MGCGRGEFLNEFTKLGMNGFGIDLSNYADKFCENAEIKIVDITKEKIPYQDNSFDVVFSKSFIEHFYYPEEVFKEAYRVLKPAEFLLISHLSGSIFTDHSMMIILIERLY